MYEMSTGRELEWEVPRDSDYESISRGSRESIRAILNFIFSMSDEVTKGTESYVSGLGKV